MRITTAGESPGKGLFCIIEGLPSQLTVDIEEIDAALALRQSGYGRGRKSSAIGWKSFRACATA